MNLKANGTKLWVELLVIAKNCPVTCPPEPVKLARMRHNYLHVFQSRLICQTAGGYGDELPHPLVVWPALVQGLSHGLLELLLPVAPDIQGRTIDFGWS